MLEQEVEVEERSSCIGETRDGCFRPPRPGVKLVFAPFPQVLPFHLDHTHNGYIQVHNDNVY